jgi:hypothetical protein
MSRLEDDASRLDNELRDLIERARKHRGTDLSTLVSLLEIARANLQGLLVELRLKAKSK